MGAVSLSIDSKISNQKEGEREPKSASENGPMAGGTIRFNICPILKPL